MEIAIGGHIDWPLFNAIVSKQKFRQKSFPINLQIIRDTFDTFREEGNFLILKYYIKYIIKLKFRHLICK